MDHPRVLAYYLHDIDPTLIQFTESFGIRWYGLAYVMGFLAGYLLMVWLAKRKYGVLKADEISDFITLAALLGVMLGGRLGWGLFYALVDNEGFRNSPWEIFQVWKGGMSAHGGILGLAIFTFFYAKKKGYNWTAVGDNLVAVAPLGIFFGRIANFINGELYGKPYDGKFAVQFPDSLRERGLAEVQERLPQLAEQSDQIAAQLNVHPQNVFLQSVKNAIGQNPEVETVLRSVIEPRYPSQLIQAALEGLCLFAILFAIRLKWKKLPYGILSGLFFLLYAVFRMIGEVFREADSGHILGLQKGAFYSIFFVAIGMAFIAYGIKRGSKLVATGDRSLL